LCKHTGVFVHSTTCDNAGNHSPSPANRLSQPGFPPAIVGFTATAVHRCSPHRRAAERTGACATRSPRAAYRGCVCT
jgi:hypothetical protein